MTRVDKWDSVALNDFLNQRAQEPFEWGVNDCALFAADGIKAITGIDIAEDFRGKYTTETGALRAIKTICNGTTVEDATEYCANKHALKEWPNPLFAQRGDLVVFENGRRLIAGLVHLNGRDIVAVGESGLYRFRITEASIKRAWHV